MARCAIYAPAPGRCGMNPPARTLAGHLAGYLALRRAPGCKLIRAGRHLRQFLDYLGERQLGHLQTGVHPSRRPSEHGRRHAKPR